MQLWEYGCHNELIYIKRQGIVVESYVMIYLVDTKSVFGTMKHCSKRNVNNLWVRSE